MRHCPLTLLIVLLLAAPALAQQTRPAGTVRLATWNIENWRDHFQSERDRNKRAKTDEEKQALRAERYQNDEDNWEIAQTILDEAFLPDVLVFQEGAAEREVQSFKDKWLDGKYNRSLVFPGNSERGQTLGVLLRPGVEVVEVRDAFYEEPDLPEDVNPRSDRLFARGPAFVLLEKGGYRFWVGTTHQKSKGGNDVPTTVWRQAEARRTNQIMRELAEESGVEDVYLLGDMNDEIGFQEYEQEAGGDVMAVLGEGMTTATAGLAEAGAITFTGYWRDRYRSFIDHVVHTPAADANVVAVGVVDTPWARVASDHAPVFVDVKPDAE